MTTLGFSPCPNDTFIFYALLNGRLDTKGLQFEPKIEDVETLNRLALQRVLDITKVSCHAFHHVRDDYRFLRSGGAFGRGCGPLVVSLNSYSPNDLKGKKIAIPGKLTTAYLLLKLFFHSVFGSKDIDIVPMVFHAIPSAVKEGKVDAGVIIHESRFTYPEYGLNKVLDMGEWWEKETGLPIPLGGIIGKKSLGTVLDTVESLIRESVAYAHAHKTEAMPYLKRYSQELSESVINDHISLYVNEFTADMGGEGRAALDELLKRAESAAG
jgi:1,4-dihydroxy-6-naphthoate synthase